MTSHSSKQGPRNDSDSEIRPGHAAQGSTVGPHNTKLANKLDPRAKNNRDPAEKHLGSVHDYGKGGTKSHNSNIANKLDPRVWLRQGQPRLSWS